MSASTTPVSRNRSQEKLNITIKKVRYMKALYSIVIAGLLFLALPATSNAQDWMTALTYDMSLPTDYAADFTSSNMQFRGFSIQGRKYMEKNLTVGLLFGWHVLYNRTSDLLVLEDGAVKGLQDRYINAFPLTIGAHYYLGKRREVRPYAGLNAGATIFAQRYDIGMYSLTEDNWRLNVTPEIGVLIPVDYDLSFLLSVKYNYSFAGPVLGGSEAISYVGFNVGLAWE